MAKDANLEILLRDMFEIAPERASKAADAFTETEFLANYQRLEYLIGNELAPKVVKDGEFLEYSNKRLEMYFQLVGRAIDVMDRELGIPAFPFYSIENLKTYLGIGTINDKSTLRQRYKLLDGSEQSRCYLDSLAEKGELTIESDERWNGGRRQGVRGNDILRIIGIELTRIFNDLNYEPPERYINFGQSKITVEGGTRATIGKIRDMFYIPK